MAAASPSSKAGRRQAYLNATRQSCAARAVLGTLEQVPDAAAHCPHAKGASYVIKNSVGAGFPAMVHSMASPLLGRLLGHHRLLEETALLEWCCQGQEQKGLDWGKAYAMEERSRDHRLLGETQRPCVERLKGPMYVDRALCSAT